MATLAAEGLEPPPPVQQKPIANGDIAHPESRGQSTKDRLLSLEAWARDISRPIRTFNFRRLKPVQNVDPVPKSIQRLQVAAIYPAQDSTQRRQSTVAPAILQGSPAVPSGPAAQVQLAQSQVEDPPSASVASHHSVSGSANAATQVVNLPPKRSNPPSRGIALEKSTPGSGSATLGSIPQAGPSTAQRAIGPFVKRAKFFEAKDLPLPPSLQDQWSSSGRAIVDKALKDLHLGPKVISNLNLIMLGPAEDDKCMKPTILIVCDKTKIKNVDNGLRKLVQASFPEHVDLKVIPGRVMLASGALCSLPRRPGGMGNLVFYTGSLGGAFPFLGRAGIFDGRRAELLMYEICTIGGLINIGNALYGLTVAHSLQEIKTGTISRAIGVPCGNIEFYEWSGDDETELEAMSEFRPGKHMLSYGMDWMVVRLDRDYIASNSFKSPDGTVQQMVTGSLTTSELTNDDVWIFSRNSQIGFLDSTPATIVLGQVSYDVFSIALKFPLILGDSGSWVVKNNKLCGYIFAILEDEPWAYMLPIEPVFDEIGRLFPQHINRPGVPDAATLERLLALAQSNDPELSSKIPDSSSQIDAHASVDKSVKIDSTNLALPGQDVVRSRAPILTASTSQPTAYDTITSSAQEGPSLPRDSSRIGSSSRSVGTSERSPPPPPYINRATQGLRPATAHVSRTPQLTHQTAAVTGVADNEFTSSSSVRGLPPETRPSQELREDRELDRELGIIDLPRRDPPPLESTRNAALSSLQVEPSIASRTFSQLSRPFRSWWYKELSRSTGRPEQAQSQHQLEEIGNEESLPLHGLSDFQNQAPRSDLRSGSTPDVSLPWRTNFPDRGSFHIGMETELEPPPSRNRYSAFWNRLRKRYPDTPLRM